jgi:O-antigen ligase
MADGSFNNVGGTPGGLGQFVMGLIMSCVGGYLISNQVSVVGSYWSFWGANSFGITLIPMLFGVAMLFFNGKSRIGWFLTIAGGLFILAGVIANMNIHIQQTSLFNIIVMLVLLVGGLALIARSVRSHHEKAAEQ